LAVGAASVGLGTGTFPQAPLHGDVGARSGAPAHLASAPSSALDATGLAQAATRTQAVGLQTPPPQPVASAPPSAGAPADALLIRAHGAESATGTRATVSPAPAPTRESSPSRWLVPAAIVLLLLAVGGFVLLRGGGSPARGEASGATGGTSTASMTTTPTPAVTPAKGPVAPSVSETAVTGGAVAHPVTSSASTAATPMVPKADPWVNVRRDTTQGRFDRAIAAIDQVQGVPAALLQEERVRVVENARRQTLAARRGAEDLRLTGSPQYVLGTTRQAEADRDRTAGRLKTAVSGYMASRAHFLRAFTDSGKAAPAAVVAPPVSEPPPPPPTSTAAPSSTTAPTANAPGEPRVDMSTWSVEEAHATIAQFCGAYKGRDMGGLGRLWPNMGPEWRNELREAFATSGELVCVFEDVRVIRTSEEFTGTARLLTQLPGSEQRRRGLSLTLVPARDRLVIGNVRVR